MLSDSLAPLRSRAKATRLAARPRQATTRSIPLRHLGRIVEATDRLHEHVHRHAEQQHGVGEGGEDLEPVEPERLVAAIAASRRQLDGGQRHAESEHVGEHVPGVGQQGQEIR